MKIIRAADCRTTPWKNGSGSTTEIAVEPPNASLDDFHWRISMARVASDGPFSEFAGIDRTLAVVTGRGLALTIGDEAEVLLDRDSDPVSFSGNTLTWARLLAGEITDLNVMTRRGRFQHRLLRIREPADCDFDKHDIAVVIATSGGVSLNSPQGAATLVRGEAAILTRADDARCRIAPAMTTEFYLALLHECLACQAG